MNKALVFFTLLTSIGIQSTVAQTNVSQRYDEFNKVNIISSKQESLVGKLMSKLWLSFTCSKYLFIDSSQNEDVVSLSFYFKTDVTTSIDKKSKVFIKLDDESIIQLSNLGSYSIETEGGILSCLTDIDRVNLAKITGHKVVRVRIETNRKNFDFDIEKSKQDLISKALQEVYNTKAHHK